MSLLSAILGGESIAAPITAIGNVVDQLFTSDEEKLDKETILTRLAQAPNIAQTEINKLEAQHRSIFVAGWRPFIGWVCGFGLTWHFILYDFLKWLSTICEWPTPPELTGTEQLVALVGSLLGLGILRTLEKFGGKVK